MTVKYDTFGAPITETVHEPIVDHWPRTETTPAELAVTCVCGGWEFTSQESIGGGVEPYGAAFEEHVEEMERDTADCGDQG